MITPFEDKIAIKAILDTDPYISEIPIKPKNIKTTKYGTEILNSSSEDFQIFIYMGTPENIGSPIGKGITYNIAVVGKRTRSNVVDNVAAQIIALLHEQEIGHAHILYLLDPPVELSSDPALYIVETTFIIYGTVFNKIKQ